MERVELIRTLMEEKRRGMEAYERYLNEKHLYAPGMMLYMREVHFLTAVGPGGEPTVSELAARLGVTHGAVSQLAGRLEKKGLVQRTANPKDRRQSIVRLTDAGKELCRRHQAADQRNYGYLSQWLDGFSDEEVSLVLRYEACMRDFFETVNKDIGERLL